MLKMASSSLLIFLIKSLIASASDVLSIFRDINCGVHLLSCMNAFLGLSAMVGMDSDLFDKCFRVCHGSRFLVLKLVLKISITISIKMLSIIELLIY